MAAGYTVTKDRPIGSTRPPWGIITNRNHPSGRSGEQVGFYYPTRKEALEEVEQRARLDRSAP
jgi:hypothetical protein